MILRKSLMDTERTNITREVGSRIRYARKSRGMSMDELAQGIYKTRSAITVTWTPLGMPVMVVDWPFSRVTLSVFGLPPASV